MADGVQHRSGRGCGLRGGWAHRRRARRSRCGHRLREGVYARAPRRCCHRRLARARPDGERGLGHRPARGPVQLPAKPSTQSEHPLPPSTECGSSNNETFALRRLTATLHRVIQILCTQGRPNLSSGNLEKPRLTPVLFGYPSLLRSFSYLLPGVANDTFTQVSAASRPRSMMPTRLYHGRAGVKKHSRLS